MLCLVAAALTSGAAGALYGVHTRREAAHLAIAPDGTGELYSAPFSLTGWRSARGEAAVSQRDGLQATSPEIETTAAQPSPNRGPRRVSEPPPAPTQETSPASVQVPDAKRTTSAEMAGLKPSRSEPPPVEKPANKELPRDAQREPAPAAIATPSADLNVEEAARELVPHPTLALPPADAPAAASKPQRPVPPLAGEPDKETGGAHGKAEPLVSAPGSLLTPEAPAASLASSQPIAEARPRPESKPPPNRESKPRKAKATPDSGSDDAKPRPRRVVLRPKPADPEPLPMELLPKLAP